MKNPPTDEAPGCASEPDSILGNVSEDVFFDVADSFIELANQHGEKLPTETISAAITYAASRYNAYVAASESDDDRLAPKTATEYYTLQYRKMFEDNLSDCLGSDSPGSDDPESVSDT